jgi:hypothetical protein
MLHRNASDCQKHGTCACALSTQPMLPDAALRKFSAAQWYAQRASSQAERAHVSACQQAAPRLPRAAAAAPFIDKIKFSIIIALSTNHSAAACANPCRRTSAPSVSQAMMTPPPYEKAITELPVTYGFLQRCVCSYYTLPWSISGRL